MVPVPEHRNPWEAASHARMAEEIKTVRRVRNVVERVDFRCFVQNLIS